MSNLYDHQLTHPELMSKDTLIEVLKTRCIQLPEVKSMSKEELLNIYRRIALPLPQRNYVETRYLGKKMASLRVQNSIPVANFGNNTDLEKLTQQNGLNGMNKYNNSHGRLKPPIENEFQSKKLCLTNNLHTKTVNESENKRKIQNNSEVSPNKSKRQKITWP